MGNARSRSDRFIRAELIKVRRATFNDDKNFLLYGPFNVVVSGDPFGIEF